jgi:hypothetical protein
VVPPPAVGPGLAAAWPPAWRWIGRWNGLQPPMSRLFDAVNFPFSVSVFLLLFLF